MKKSNFITIENHHINTDHIMHFRWEHKTLVLFVGPKGESFTYADPLGEKYRKVCTAVGVDPVDAQKSVNVNVAVYAELDEKRQLVQICNSLDSAVYFCRVHNWKVATINRPELDPVREGVLKIELWKGVEPAEMEVASK